MQATADFRQEKHELDTILASGILSRAPNLAQLLTYVCTKYFEGAGSQIKEYNIAVEALGRPADFNQKRDSIVRVEAHRLRKRLSEYYEADGADHAIRIEIPPGQYAPRFVTARTLLPSLSFETLVAQADLSSEALEPESTTPESEALVESKGLQISTPVAPQRPDHRMRNGAVFGGLLLVIVALSVARWRPAEKRPANPASIPAPIAAAVSNPLELRILAGRQNGEYTDRLGRIWQSD